MKNEKHKWRYLGNDKMSRAKNVLRQGLRASWVFLPHLLSSLIHFSLSSLKFTSSTYTSIFTFAHLVLFDSLLQSWLKSFLSPPLSYLSSDEMMEKTDRKEEVRKKKSHANIVFLSRLILSPKAMRIGLFDLFATVNVCETMENE